MVLRGDLTYGDVLAFTTYAMQLLYPALRFSELARQLQELGVAADRMFELFDETPEVGEAPHPVSVGRLGGRVEFDHVHFHYDEGVPVIQDFNLSVQPGQTVALIGHTGCGKTTILSLLLRFFDVVEGSVRLDGHDIRQISLDDLRSQFGIVLQEPLLFQTTLADNIRYGNPVCDRAGCRAGGASGGDSRHDHGPAQRVRLRRRAITACSSPWANGSGSAIARAIAADPAILVMDEATSALDSESERAIQLAMDRVLVGRTSFIVAHRLSTIRNADLILLLDGGRIVEQGSHDQLMAMQGRYASLYEKFMGTGVLQEEEKEHDGTPSQCSLPSSPPGAALRFRDAGVLTAVPRLPLAPPRSAAAVRRLDEFHRVQPVPARLLFARGRGPHPGGEHRRITGPAADGDAQPRGQGSRRVSRPHRGRPSVAAGAWTSSPLCVPGRWTPCAGCG